MITINDAVRALDDRKTSCYGGGRVFLTRPLWRHVVVGLDLDADEAFAATDLARAFVVPVLGRLVLISEAMEGAWLDGLVTGVLLAELRAREQVRS